RARAEKLTSGTVAGVPALTAYNYAHFDAYVESGQDEREFDAFPNILHGGERAPDGELSRLDGEPCPPLRVVARAGPDARVRLLHLTVLRRRGSSARPARSAAPSLRLVLRLHARGAPGRAPGRARQLRRQAGRSPPTTGRARHHPADPRRRPRGQRAHRLRTDAEHVLGARPRRHDPLQGDVDLR